VVAVRTITRFTDQRSYHGLSSWHGLLVRNSCPSERTNGSLFSPESDTIQPIADS
jgi:hypothetical protein